jgi:hypothetical protein
MRHYVFGFQQLELIRFGLTAEDALFLRTLINYLGKNNKNIKQFYSEKHSDAVYLINESQIIKLLPIFLTRDNYIDYIRKLSGYKKNTKKLYPLEYFYIKSELWICFNWNVIYEIEGEK